MSVSSLGGSGRLGKGSVGEGSTASLDYRRPSVFSLFEGEDDVHLLVLCAEPGMGKRFVIADALVHAEDEGFKVLHYNLRGMDSHDAAGRVSDLARRAVRASSSGARVIVGIDEIPPADEQCVRREARAFSKMLSGGVSVIVSMVPEGRQLLEVLNDCLVLGTQDLLASGITDLTRSSQGYGIRACTRGIPTLVESLLSAEPGTQEHSSLPVSYYDAMGELVEASLRPTLTDEELRLRLAMILLGKGLIDDLRVVLGSVARDILSDVCTNAPLFGIDEELSRFDCLGCDSAPVGAACIPCLGSMCSAFPDVALGCASFLAKHSRINRAAYVCKLSGSVASGGLILQHAAEFFEAGEADLVEWALDGHGADQGESLGTLQTCEIALAAVSDRGFDPELPEKLSGLVARQDAREKDLSMVVEARLVLQGSAGIVPFSSEDWTPMGRRLLAHREAWELMCEGKFTAALRLLVANPGEDVSSSLSSALLALDRELVATILCDSAREDSKESEMACELLAPMEGMGSYVALVRLVERIALGTSEGSEEAEVLVSRAERAGDVLVQAAGLVVGCLLDLRHGSFARADVRSRLGIVISRRAGSDYLARVSVTLGLLARHLLGERVEPMAEDGSQDDLSAVSELVACAIEISSGRLAPETASPVEPPRDALWLLLALMEGLGDFSELLAEQVPISWRRAIEAARKNRAGIGGKDGSGRRLLSGLSPSEVMAIDDVRRLSPDSETKMELVLLGDFVVRVGGERVQDAKLDRRDAKSMLEFLALQSGGCARRFEIVEQIWPESDYKTGFSKAYQAASALRAAVKELDQDIEPLVTSRASRTIGLNRAVVCCDVDEFRYCACEAVSAGDDERAVEMARRAEQLYAGDLYIPPKDATGFIAAARSELKVLYADAMVSGADAAYRMGNRRMATRLATNAMLVDDLREDAVIILVRSLRASGRAMEATREYQRYASRLARATKGTPSQMLRLAAGEGSGSAPGRERGAGADGAGLTE